MGITPTAPFSLTTYSASTTSTAAFDYKTAIDSNFVAGQRLTAAFAVTEQLLSSARNMTLHVAAGFIFNGIVLTEVAAQDTATIIAPSASPRIDRIVANARTGAVSVIGGTEATVPGVPSLPGGVIPLARVTIQADAERLGNSMLTDERAGVWADVLPWDYQEFTTPGSTTWAKPDGTSTDALVIAMVWGGGGGGHGSAASWGSGGAGGACSIGLYKASALSTSVAVVVAAGSTADSGINGGDGQFGSQFAYGGAANGGGGGGVMGAGTGGAGGAPLGGVFGSTTTSIFGGGGNAANGDSVYGGGGGGASVAASTQRFTVPGRSLYGGGGGAGGYADFKQGGGSVFGGQGGYAYNPPTTPGGGGGGSSLAFGSNNDGARGEVRVWTMKRVS